jgi:hypothetical protein
MIVMLPTFTNSKLSIFDSLLAAVALALFCFAGGLAISFLAA